MRAYASILYCLQTHLTSFPNRNLDDQVNSSCNQVLFWVPVKYHCSMNPIFIGKDYVSSDSGHSKASILEWSVKESVLVKAAMNNLIHL